jgi:ClpP class serine protease
MGRPAVELRLVDRVGTLDETIEAAKRAAGIEPGRRTRVVEYPKRGFIKLPQLFSLPSLSIGGEVIDEAGPDKTYEEMVLEGILQNPGQPLLFAPSGLLPDENAATR